MDNFSPAQYERFEAYRRHALPKQAVRKVCRLFSYSLCFYPNLNLFLGYSTIPWPTSISTCSPNHCRIFKSICWRNRRERLVLVFRSTLLVCVVGVRTT